MYTIPPERPSKSSDLPPARNTPALRTVSPPLSHISFRRFNYYIALAAGILFAIYAWRITKLKAEAGSWWNLALGRRPPPPPPPHGGYQYGQAAGFSSNPPRHNSNHGTELTVEDRINDLAIALGMPSKQLASAIAVAVREYVPPATLSSIAAHQSGDAVRYLLDPEGAPSADAGGTNAVRGFEAVATAFEAAVGFDELPTVNDID
ncbi:hypothetical protein ABKN59_000710 [Abortiporus biennis]